MLPPPNLAFGWCWVLLGLLSGTAIGLFFHRADWLGGYDAWPRRMVRLGHISFFGTGLLNLFFALSLPRLSAEGALPGVAGTAWVVGAVAMPAVCFLSAWKKPLRNLFFVPVGALLLGGVLTCWLSLRGAGP